MAEQIGKLKPMTKIAVEYVLFPASRRRIDLGNPLSITEKFFLDALVELGKIPDDDYNHVVASFHRFGEVDSKNPRVEITITEIE